MLSIFADTGIDDAKVWCGEADRTQRSFEEAAEHALDVLVVLGGDGTIRTAAEACRKHNCYLLPLPGGTMNMLPRALYGDLPWEDALKNTLAAPAPKELSGGRVGNNQFFVAATIGTAPVIWAEARESVRDGEIGDAIAKGSVGFQKLFQTTVQYSIAGEINGEAEAVVVICPLISQAMSDSEHALEVAVIDVENITELIGLATAAAFGQWRNDRNVLLHKTKQLVVQSSNDLLAILDGEKVNLGRRAEIEFTSRAVNVIAPAT